MLKQFFNNSMKRISSLSPQAAIAGALIIVVVISGLALLLTRGGSEANANPALQPHAARLDKVEGNVGIARAQALAQDATAETVESADWTEATVNTPITVGDRIYTRDYAHASVALSGQNYVRLNPATSLDVLALEDSRTQFALRSGSALFDVGALPSGELYEVATPCGAVNFKEPGLYQIGMDGENAIISVLNGVAQVVGQEGSGLITKGQVFTLTSATAAEALASTLEPATAGEIVDDYYRYRYPKVYNGRYRDYDAYLDDPSYYDPYRTSVSYQYLQADIPGLYDLDDYGEWVDVNDYGHCWAPRVSAGWAPYRSGYWDVDDLWGPSWVSSEPWGWAPYHYGRWAFVNHQWFWVPAEVRQRVVYSPALVAFIPIADQIAWLPLGPGEVYVPRYYDNFRPRYLASQDVVQVVTVQNTFVNFNAPGAVTVVPLRSFRRGVDPRVITPVDLAVVRRSQAVIDPFSVAGVRELATRRDDGRQRIKFDSREQQALNTAVVGSATPRVLPGRGDLAKRFRVEAVSENRRDNKLRVNNTAEVTSSRRSDGLAQPPVVQSQRLNELAGRAQQGDQTARREMRQLMREERRSGKPLANLPATQPPAAVQQGAQQEQLRQQMKQQRKAERQQQSGGATQQQQQMRQQQQQQQLRQQQQQQMRQQQQQQQLRQQQQKASQQQQQQLRQQQQKASQQQQQQLRQQQQRQQPPARRKPPEASAQQQQLRREQTIQRAQAGQRQAAMQQQHAARAQAAQRQAAMQQKQQQHAARAQAAQRQAAMQQQQQHAARAQASQRQAAMQQQQQQHAARAQASQRQAAMQQQHAARAQASQRQAAMQQQQQQHAARAQAAPRQARPSTQRAPALQGGPTRQDAQKGGKGQRRP